MKILIDESLSEDLKKEFSDFDVFTVNDMKWNSKKNGELLSLMVENSFDIFVTLDKNLKYQQNLKKFPLKIFCFRVNDSKLETIMPLIPQLKRNIEV